jgi:hypothetical protein
MTAAPPFFLRDLSIFSLNIFGSNFRPEPFPTVAAVEMFPV